MINITQKYMSIKLVKEKQTYMDRYGDIVQGKVRRKE
jgi:hypothetical protein